MTIRYPRRTWGDRLLARWGKQRAVYVPDVYRRFGIYAIGRGVREPFWRALLRRRGRPLAPGWAYLDAGLPTEKGETNPN